MLSGLRGRPPWPVRGWACLGARFNKAGGPGLVSGKVRPVEGSCSRPVGEGNASSHRYARLRQQLQRAGQAEAWGHRQQPARVVPVMGPLEEQRRLFVPPGPGKACRWLPHSHLSACFLPLQSVPFPAQFLRKRTWQSSTRARGEKGNAPARTECQPVSGEQRPLWAGDAPQESEERTSKPQAVCSWSLQEFVFTTPKVEKHL